MIPYAPDAVGLVVVVLIGLGVAMATVGLMAPSGSRLGQWFDKLLDFILKVGG